MLKKLLILIILFSSIESAKGQVLISLIFGETLNSDAIEFGLEGGFNWSKIDGMEGDKLLRNFNLGFYFDIRLVDMWSIYTGCLVKSNLGTNKLTENDMNFLQKEIYEDPGDYSQEIRYFLVPALIRYTFENKIYMEGGFQFGLQHGAWVEYNTDHDGRDATIKDYNEDDINRIDAGLMAGIGYKLRKGKAMSFGLRYYYGLVDVYKNRSGTKNSAIFLKMTLPIGAG